VLRKAERDAAEAPPDDKQSQRTGKPQSGGYQWLLLLVEVHPRPYIQAYEDVDAAGLRH
jgi:hypothetical protein